MTQKRTVFIVEDDGKIARIVADYLTSKGHSPRIFPDARSVVDEARKAPPAAIVLDIMLPAGNGVDLCRRLREFWQNHSVRAFLTGLRKKGESLVREERPFGATVYRIEKQSAAEQEGANVTA